MKPRQYCTQRKFQNSGVGTRFPTTVTVNLALSIILSLPQTEDDSESLPHCPEQE